MRLNTGDSMAVQRQLPELPTGAVLRAQAQQMLHQAMTAKLWEWACTQQGVSPGCQDCRVLRMGHLATCCS